MHVHLSHVAFNRLRRVAGQLLQTLRLLDGQPAVAQRLDEPSQLLALFDFGKAGQETDPNGAEQWNDVTAVAADSTVATDLEDTAGADTGIDLYLGTGAVSGTGVATLDVGGWDASDATTTGFPLSATRDGIVIFGGTNVLWDAQLRGLDDSKLYELTFYAHVNGSRDFCAWEIDGVTRLLSPSAVNDDMVTFTNVPTNGAGAIDIRWKGLDDAGSGVTGSGYNSEWNVLKITELNVVPEPGTLVLAAAGLLGLVFASRRRRGER